MGVKGVNPNPTMEKQVQISLNISVYVLHYMKSFGGTQKPILPGFALSGRYHTKLELRCVSSTLIWRLSGLKDQLRTQFKERNMWDKNLTGSVNLTYIHKRENISTKQEDITSRDTLSWCGDFTHHSDSYQVHLFSHTSIFCAGF